MARKRSFGKRFFFFLNQLVQRAGLRSARLTAHRVHGRIPERGMALTLMEAEPPIPGRPPLDINALIQDFRLRLDRLLHCVVFPFGHVEVEIQAGEVKSARFCLLFMPEEGDKLDTLFNR